MDGLLPLPTGQGTEGELSHLGSDSHKSEIHKVGHR